LPLDAAEALGVGGRDAVVVAIGEGDDGWLSTTDTLL
jgi:hypothetical protein